jgi:hypothetical protein
LLYKRVIILAVVVFAMAVFWTIISRRWVKEKTMESRELPVIRVAIGRKITEVQVKSNMDFRLAEKDDDTPHIIEEPVLVEYDDPQRSLRLPPTRFVWISQYGAVVAAFETSPHLNFLTLEEAHVLANQLADQLAGSGWSIVRRPSLDINQVRAEVLNPERYWSYERLYGEWSAGSIRLELTLRESGPQLPPERRLEAEFVINLRFQDKALREEMQNLIYQKRKEVNGDINHPLPLNYYLSSER